MLRRALSAAKTSVGDLEQSARGLEGAALAGAAEAAAASTEAAAAKSASESTTVATSAEDLAQHHASDDIARGRGTALLHLPATIIVDVVLSSFKRGLGSVDGPACGVLSRTNITALKVKGLGVEVLGIGQGGTGTRTNDAPARGDEIVCGLNIGFRYRDLLLEKSDLAGMRRGFLAHSVEAIIELGVDGHQRAIAAQGILYALGAGGFNCGVCASKQFLEAVPIGLCSLRLALCLQLLGLGDLLLDFGDEAR